MSEIKVVQRAEWHAQPPRIPAGAPPIGPVAEPVGTVFIHTSVTAQLSRLASLKNERQAMRDIQNIAFGRGFYDISYSFLVFPSGRVYEGRGWGKAGAHTEGYNSTAYAICTAGNTDVYKPTWQQRRAIRRLVNKGQRHGHIRKVVDLRGHREVAPKACPGAKFTDALLARLQRRVNAA